MKHNIIFSGQIGFRTKHSTEHAFLLITDKLHRELLKVIIFLDHSKAFDTVDHNILLAKLYLYGIRGQCCFVYDWVLLYKHQWNTRWAFPRKHDIFTLENNMLFPRVKISPLLWLHNKSRLSQDKTVSVKWFGISLVFI